jgi:hypothetical protein
MAGDEDRGALRRLEQRLDEASEAAQRLMAEAAQAAEQEAAGREPPGADAGPDRGSGETKPPPAGWQTSEDRRSAPTPGGAELDALIGALRSLRELVPPEVLQRLSEAVKDVLLAIRALIDWYIERLDRRPTGPPPVKDIPIE